MAQTCQTLPSLSSWAHRRVPETEFATYSPAMSVAEGSQFVSNNFFPEWQHLKDREINDYFENRREERERIGYESAACTTEYDCNFSQDTTHDPGQGDVLLQDTSDGGKPWQKPRDTIGKRRESVSNSTSKIRGIEMPTFYSYGENYGSQDLTFLHELSGANVPFSYQFEGGETQLASEEILFENACWQSNILSSYDEDHEEQLGLEEHETSKKLTGQQRMAANRRERRRMNTINQAFEALRMHLPVLECERKLSKADTLRVAVEYIKFMDHILKTTSPKNSDHSRRGDMLLITRKIETGSQSSVDENGAANESLSVLLTWSKKRKVNYSFIENGKRKVRAPIWNPEFPATVLERKRRRSVADTLSQLHEDGFHDPINKILRLSYERRETDRSDVGMESQCPQKSLLVRGDHYPLSNASGEIQSNEVSIPHLNTINVYHPALNQKFHQQYAQSSYTADTSHYMMVADGQQWKHSAGFNEIRECYNDQHLLETKYSSIGEVYDPVFGAAIIQNRDSLSCDEVYSEDYNSSSYRAQLIYYPCNDIQYSA